MDAFGWLGHLLFVLGNCCDLGHGSRSKSLNMNHLFLVPFEVCWHLILTICMPCSLQ